MLLNRVWIKNFRSISDCTISIDRSYQILVGINESGKSNILKAFSLIDDTVEITKNDIRDPSHDEDNVEESLVRFVFTLENYEINKVINALKEKFICKNLNKPLLTIGDTEANLRDFLKYKSEALYNVDVMNNKRSPSHWKLEGLRFKVKNNWKQVASGKSTTYQIAGTDKNLPAGVVVDIDDYVVADPTVLEDLDITKLNILVGNQFVEIVKANKPSSVLWRYLEANLLPGKIVLSTFRGNPDTCIPLKIMFNLSDVEDISKAITEAENKTNGLKNLFKRVSEKTTAHMKRVWPEWEKLTVQVSQNGDYIEAGIQDEYNFYSLERRSDGFKRFFSFLLLISGQNKTNDLVGNIILIDEPEIGVHPTGQKFLGDELVKISGQNTVLAATHSIFMIDKNQIARHILVKKNKEITNIERVEHTNITEEEVIFNALGYSVYELLKPKNIIFEGWRDKMLFELFLKSKNGSKVLGKKEQLQVGLLHAVGVKDIPRIASICENYNREYVIISDSDKPALEKQRDFHRKERWLTYKDIQSGVTAVTTEDFVSKSVINKAVKHILKDFVIEGDISIPDALSEGYIHFIESKIKNIFATQVDHKKLLNDIKDHIFESVKADDLVSAYAVAMQTVVEKLQKV